jgi:hypothetical protein
VSFHELISKPHPLSKPGTTYKDVTVSKDTAGSAKKPMLPVLSTSLTLRDAHNVHCRSVVEFCSHPNFQACTQKKARRENVLGRFCSSGGCLNLPLVSTAARGGFCCAGACLRFWPGLGFLMATPKATAPQPDVITKLRDNKITALSSTQHSQHRDSTFNTVTALSQLATNHVPAPGSFT